MTGIQQESRRGHAQLVTNVKGRKDKRNGGQRGDRNTVGTEGQQGQRKNRGTRNGSRGRGFHGFVTAEHAHACGGSSPHRTPLL